MAANTMLDTGSQVIQLDSVSGLTFGKGTATIVSQNATINAQSGTLTSPSGARAPGNTVIWTLHNTFIVPSSVILLSMAPGTNTVYPLTVASGAITTGSCAIYVTNNSSSSTNGTFLVNFLVL